MLNIQKICLVFIKIYRFYQKERKLKNAKSLSATYRAKKTIVHIRALKQALNHVLKPKTVHKVIQFNQKAWSKPFIDMNTKSRKEPKNKFEKDLFKLMNNAIFGKTMERQK